MSQFAQNKPLIEYGDLASEHHALRHERELEEQRMQQLQEEPPKLIITDGPGNLYFVSWSYGDMEVPFECHGSWNHRGRAMDAIRAANARLNKAAQADILAKAQAEQQAQFEQDVAAEKARLEAEVADEPVALAPAKKATRKKATD